MHVSIILRIRLRDVRKGLCSNTVKTSNWKFIFPWGVINRHVLQIAKAYFMYTIWFMISGKSIMGCTFLCNGSYVHQKSQKGIQKKLCTRISNSFSLFKLPSFGVVGFTDMNTYRLTESNNFKTFLEENYAIVFDSCYLFTKKMLNVKLNMMLIVFIEVAYIRHSWTLKQIRWIPYGLSRC